MVPVRGRWPEPLCRVGAASDSISMEAARSKIPTARGREYQTDAGGGELGHLGPVAKLFSVLGPKRPKCIKMTKVAKVLARERLGLIPVHGKYVSYCYTDCADAAVRPAKGRSWEEYSRAWLRAVEKDLTDQLDHWRALAAIAPGEMISPTEGFGHRYMAYRPTGVPGRRRSGVGYLAGLSFVEAPRTTPAQWRCSWQLPLPPRA